MLNKIMTIDKETSHNPETKITVMGILEKLEPISDSERDEAIENFKKFITNESLLWDFNTKKLSEQYHYAVLDNMYEDETKFIKKNNIRIISISQLKENLVDVCDGIMEFSNNKELYVSFDIDIVDPAFAPGTGYPEPGGLSSREFIYLVQRMNRIKNLKAVDLVEINPEKDRDGLTVKLGAKIVGEFV